MQQGARLFSGTCSAMFLKLSKCFQLVHAYQQVAKTKFRFCDHPFWGLELMQKQLSITLCYLVYVHGCACKLCFCTLVLLLFKKLFRCPREDICCLESCSISPQRKQWQIR